MSVTCGFYNSIDGDRRYNAEQLTSLVDGIIRDGVFMGIGDALIVSASTGMNVIVGTGRAWFNSTWTHNDSLLPLAVDPAEMILNRIDAVVLEVNRSMDVRENTIKMVKGTPASVPVPPTLIKSELVNQYALAHVYVGAGVTQITAANITNKVGTDDCPFVTGILQTLNLTALLAQWDGEFHDILNLRDSQFANLLSSSETQFANMINTQNTQFTNMLNTRDTEFANMISQRDSEFLAWFELIEATLDENIAANLLNMINNHKADNVSHVAYGIASGTNDKTISLSPAPSAYVDGMALAFKNVTQNTGAVTINVNGLGAKSILKSNGSALASGNLKANSVYTIRYNGSNFILQGEGGEYGNVTPDKVLAGTTFGTEDGVNTGTMPDLSNSDVALGYGTITQINPDGNNSYLVYKPGNKEGYIAENTTFSARVKNLSAPNLKHGVSVGGNVGFDIVGSYDSDANGTAANLLANKVLYGKGQRITGTMPNNGAKIITPSTTNQAIPAGYHDGSGYVKGDVNLLPANIKNGVTIFGKTGTYNPLSTLVAGENIFLSFPSPYAFRGSNSSDPSMGGSAKLTFQTLVGGTLNFYFRMRNTEYTAYMALYVDEVKQASQSKSASSSYSYYTKLLTVNPNSIVKLYVWSSNNVSTTYVRDVAIKTTITSPIQLINMQ